MEIDIDNIDELLGFAVIPPKPNQLYNKKDEGK